MTERTKTLTVRTPEGIAFPLYIASPLTRGLAFAVDQACIYVVVSALSMFAYALAIISRDLTGFLVLILTFLVGFGYPVVFEWLWRGQTLGKRLLSLRVIDSEGLRLHLSQIIVRNILRLVDGIPLYLVGGVASFLSPTGQRLGDLAASTVVIRTPDRQVPDLDQVMPRKFNSFRAHPHLAARLRQRVSPDEAALALEAIVRRDELNADARVPLFHDIREHIEGLVHFPSEACEGVSDEQYVRNVVDVIYR